MVKFNIMNQSDAEVISPPPKIIGSLLGGFETISNHIGLILFSVGLDILFWLGPQIRLGKVINTFLIWSDINKELQTDDFKTLMDANQEALLMIGDRFNLLTALRTFPIGIPSLMLSRSPTENPIGEVFAWQIPDLTTMLWSWLILTLLGLVLGTIYFELVSRVVLQGKIDWKKVIKEWPWFMFQVILLSIFWLAIIFAISIPLSCILPFILGSGVSTILLIIFSGILIWLLFPLIFIPHGIFVYRYSMWKSVKHSVRVIRMTLPTSVLFVLAIVVLSQGLDLLWNMISDDSWLTLVAILGHAFVATSLLAATIIYYRDAHIWTESVIQKVKLSSIKT